MVFYESDKHSNGFLINNDYEMEIKKFGLKWIKSKNSSKYVNLF